MTKLFTYCIPYDDGAAPNPFWELCTLVICKPRIRRAAQEGDWIAGTGSRHSPIGDASGKLVYAMRVTKKMTMREYDDFAARQLPSKIPDWFSDDRARRCGDAIYDYSTTPPRLRDSVHNEGNRERDLGGEYALLSNDFYYFGDRAEMIPESLQAVIRQGQGHRSNSNAPYVLDFVKWLRGLGLRPRCVIGGPQMTLPPPGSDHGPCSLVRQKCAEEDERDGDVDC